MYRCNDCGDKFHIEDAEKRSECVGEFWGAPAYQEYSVCPYCGSEYIEEIDDYEDDDCDD